MIGAGYRIVEAADGDEALALASEHRPDLIVLDLMMPRMSGFDVLRRLRGDVSVDGTPIVVMSAWPNAQEAALEAGADKYIQKPFEPDDLTKIVESLLVVKNEVAVAVHADDRGQRGAAALVAGVFAVLIYAVVTLDNAREREAATKDVRTALVGLEKLVIDLESGLRGVVLTGNPRFLQPARVPAGKSIVAPASWSASLPTIRRSWRVRNLRLAINGYVGDYLEPMVNLAQENIAAVRQNLARVEAKRH